MSIEVNQLETRLKKSYNKKIDLSDHPKKNKDDLNNLFLSRALALFALSSFSGKNVSPLCVVDGYDDNGIDGVLCDMSGGRLYLVQSKWIKRGRGEPELGDVMKFVKGIKDILEPNFARFNSRMERWKKPIRELLGNPELKIHVLLAYTGDSLSNHAQEQIGDLLKEFNNINPNLVQFHRLDLKELHKGLLSKLRGEAINEDVALLEWGRSSEPYDAYYGLMKTSDIYDLWQKYGSTLFAANLRDYVGSTEVNVAIRNTLETAPETFFYKNNGITVLCHAVSKKPVGGNDRKVGYFQCKSMSVINGAQTVGSIGTITPEKRDHLEKAQVLCRLISCGDKDDAVGQELTRACNTQNAILAKDFISLDAIQKQLDIGFSLLGKKYVHRSGEESPEPDEGCTIDEATIALACQNPDVGLTVIAKTKISRLWTDRKVYPRIFTKSTSAEFVWNLVQFMRDVDRYIRLLADTEEKLEAVTVHGNRFLLHCMYQRYSKELLKKEYKIDKRGLKPEVGKLAKMLTERIDVVYADTPRYSLFKNNTKSKALSAYVLSNWK